MMLSWRSIQIRECWSIGKISIFYTQLNFAIFSIIFLAVMTKSISNAFKYEDLNRLGLNSILLMNIISKWVHYTFFKPISRMGNFIFLTDFQFQRFFFATASFRHLLNVLVLESVAFPSSPFWRLRNNLTNIDCAISNNQSISTFEFITSLYTLSVCVFLTFHRYIKKVQNLSVFLHLPFILSDWKDFPKQKMWINLNWFHSFDLILFSLRIFKRLIKTIGLFLFTLSFRKLCKWNFD